MEANMDLMAEIKEMQKQEKQISKEIEKLRKMIVERNEYAQQLSRMKDVEKKTKEEISSRILHENKALVDEIDMYLEEIKKIINALQKIKDMASSSSPA